MDDEMDNSSSNCEVKKIGHYKNTQKILLVGEGDFSFSTSLANAFGSASNMVATSLLSREELKFMHRNSEDNLKKLEGLGCLVLHNVDVHSMNNHPNLKNQEFDLIIFNFPHSGHCGFHETTAYLINRHKELMKGFFKSAIFLLKKLDGEVHITHRDDNPYNKWELNILGAEAGFTLIQKSLFNPYVYLGYRNKRGGNSRGDETFPISISYTFKFAILDLGISKLSL